MKTETTVLLFLNGGVLALLVMLGWNGQMAFLLGDRPWFAYVIAVATAAGVALSFARFRGLSSATEQEAYRWVDGLNKWSDALTAMAILGTAGGLVVGFSVYSTADLGDQAQAIQATGRALSGVAMALQNTLLGIGGYLWVRTNAALLETAASKLFPEVQSFGEPFQGRCYHDEA